MLIRNLVQYACFGLFGIIVLQVSEQLRCVCASVESDACSTCSSARLCVSDSRLQYSVGSQVSHEVSSDE